MEGWFCAECVPFPHVLVGEPTEVRREKRKGLVMLWSTFPVFTMKELDYTQQRFFPEGDCAPQGTFLVVTNRTRGACRILLASSG